MAMAAALLALLLAVVAPAVHGVEHTVGGSDGWSQSADLATWASGQNFTVGDTLLFGYSSLHRVDVVSQGDYDNCNSGNALQTYSGGQTSISLLKTGPMYFICPTAGHCSSGMKLAINVVASSSGPSGSPSILSPPTDSTPASDGNTSPKSSNSSTEGRFSHFSCTMLGFSLLVAALVSFMG